MTVKQLSEHLKNLPEEATIIVYNEVAGDEVPVTRIEYLENYSTFGVNITGKVVVIHEL